MLLTLPMWELWNGKDLAEPFDGICKMIETSLDPLGVGEEVVPGLVELEVAVPRLRPAVW